MRIDGFIVGDCRIALRNVGSQGRRFCWTDGYGCDVYGLMPSPASSRPVGHARMITNAARNRRMALEDRETLMLVALLSGFVID